MHCVEQYICETSELQWSSVLCPWRALVSASKIPGFNDRRCPPLKLTVCPPVASRCRKKAGKTIKRADAVEIIKVRVKVKHEKGLEGLAYDPKADVFYTVKEKDPMQILRVARNGTVAPQWQKHKYAQLVHNIATMKCVAR